MCVLCFTAEKVGLAQALETALRDGAEEAAEHAAVCNTVILLTQRVCRDAKELNTTRCRTRGLCAVVP